MVCNCNTLLCLELNYGAVGKGRTQKDYSRLCCYLGKRVGTKQRGWVWEELGTEGRPGKGRKWAIHWRYEKKICGLSVNGIGSPHGWCYGTIKWSYNSSLIENLESVCDTAAITNGGLIKLSQQYQRPACNLKCAVTARYSKRIG